MRKIRLFFVLFIACAVIMGLAVRPAAGAGSVISLRVEGRDKTLYYNPALYVGGNPEASMRDIGYQYNAIANVPKMTMSGDGADSRISAVGDLKEKNLGGPFQDGWIIRLNGENVSGGLDSIQIKPGDDIVVFYADPTLIQYPAVDLSRMLSDGIVRFTSDDKTTDGSGATYVTKNPVAGATVVWDGMTYRTDMRGEIIIDSTGAGVKHTVSIERHYDNGLPTVLRFMPGYSVRCPYRDVRQSDWFYGAVMFASEKQLLNGVTEMDFGPDMPITRAMFVMVLGRLAGAAADETAGTGFNDVTDDGWSSGYIVWAVRSGIAGGRPDGTFGPYENITREQLVVMLYRYAGLQGINTAAAGAGQLPYSDSDIVSDYAVSAMAWASGAGLVTGTAGRLEPQGLTSRAEVSAILERYITKFAS